VIWNNTIYCSSSKVKCIGTPQNTIIISPVKIFSKLHYFKGIHYVMK
jgi:hypothetical protein